ncbi:hypothetical protein HII28_13255 [Planctomonas sp. JC2975]|uniref:hypothetical protein n=1 Tax=Planctomonas sp. JC2975 TaxID=2729626 RepID=UPI00147403AB|nr:hypothetical protein [Planctomonas sp. JC2975]NNC12842.1 hypothetical protein [Planctomonas sp. JC2975]
MSNHRKSAWDAAGYRNRYLRSPAWYRRRAKWFIAERHQHGELRCALCLGAGTERTLDLHHLDYRGVTQGPHGWSATEPHDDLIALHPRCHEWVHKLIDRDRALSGLISRRAASAQAITRLRGKIAQLLEEASGQ